MNDCNHYRAQLDAIQKDVKRLKNTNTRISPSIVPERISSVIGQQPNCKGYRGKTDLYESCHARYVSVIDALVTSLESAKDIVHKRLQTEERAIRVMIDPIVNRVGDNKSRLQTTRDDLLQQLREVDIKIRETEELMLRARKLRDELGRVEKQMYGSLENDIAHLRKLKGPTHEWVANQTTTAPSSDQRSHCKEVSIQKECSKCGKRTKETSNTPHSFEDLYEQEVPFAADEDGFVGRRRRVGRKCANCGWVEAAT